MYGYIRTALAVLPIDVANPESNAKWIIDKNSEIADSKIDILAFPELSLTGATCGDLFFQRSLINTAADKLTDILIESVSHKGIIIVGTPLLIKGKLYNCAAVINHGTLCGVVVKDHASMPLSQRKWFSDGAALKEDTVFLKELGLFDEKRYYPYEAYNSKKNKSCPIGNRIVFNINSKVKFAVTIGDNLQSPISNSALSALCGAELVFNICADTETAGKSEERKSLVCSQSKKICGGYFYLSSGATESTTNSVFCGQTIVAQNAETVFENADDIHKSSFNVIDVDFEKIQSERLRNPSFNESCDKYESLLSFKEVFIEADGLFEGDAKFCTVSKAPFLPAKKEDEICKSVFNIQVNSLVKRLEKTSCRPVIGISGGLDSTLALLVCVEAMKKLDRPASDVIGVTMPCFGTSGRTHSNSLQLMQALGISNSEINIKDSVLSHFKDIHHKADVFDLTFENAQARERTQVLMDLAGMHGGIVIGTGDLSETALGWCTYNGDHMSMYGVNAGVPKTLIAPIIKYLIENTDFCKCKDILLDIISTPISPELLPTDRNGKMSQQTEDIVGPYELHDFFLYYILGYGFEPKKIYFLAKQAFENKYSDEVLIKWLYNFYKRFFSQQFKRSCTPDAAKLLNIGLSPRGDWEMPSDASAANWLKDVEQLQIHLNK